MNFASSGTLNLTAIAVSHGNPAVKGRCHGQPRDPVNPSRHRAVQSGLPDPRMRPDTTSFVLLVTNTGNTDDSYRISIVGQSGPITASLVGLDGSLTQTIPVFRLPGLSSGAIVVEANLASLEQGTVTVQVTSLDHAGITSTAVATVTRSCVGPPPPVSALLRRWPALLRRRWPDGHLASAVRDSPHADDARLALQRSTRSGSRAEREGVSPGGSARSDMLRITKAVYDATSDTVTLHLGRRINFHRRFKLTVYGAAPTGLANAQGLHLNSKAGSNSGSNYVTTVDRRNLVWPNWYKRHDPEGEIRQRTACDQDRRPAQQIHTSPSLQEVVVVSGKRPPSRSMTHAGKVQPEIPHLGKQHNGTHADS